jgi:hypothetical protein
VSLTCGLNLRSVPQQRPNQVAIPPRIQNLALDKKLDVHNSKNLLSSPSLSNIKDRSVIGFKHMERLRSGGTLAYQLR